MLVTRVETAAYRYVAIQSEDVVLKKMNSLKLILFTILLVSGALSVAVAFYFARRTAKPLQEIFNNLPGRTVKTKREIFSVSSNLRLSMSGKATWICKKCLRTKSPI